MRLQGGAAALVWVDVQANFQVRQRQRAKGFVRPFGQLQPGAGKNVPKARVFPLARIAKAVEVEMPDVQAVQAVGFDHRIRRAFDAPLHPQRMQQMAYQCGFAGAQIALQADKGIAQKRLPCQVLRKGLRGVFVRPVQQQRRSFYNHRVNNPKAQTSTPDAAALSMAQLQTWGQELGFSQIGVAGVDLHSAEPGLYAWLEAGFHGSMDYMQRHGTKRARPAELVPGTLSVITARMDYLPRSTPPGWQSIEMDRLQSPATGTVALYARGRDYHKVLRKRLQTLVERLAAQLGPLGHRVFTDSAPVLEAELATRSGLGWRGKHTLVLHREAGSMFFLGEIFVDVALTPTPAVESHCGSCSACIDVCPTQAIVAPYQLDARRCISYLTIEHAGSIDVQLRPLMGNRIYGCDDCQSVCPWNKYARVSRLPDFDERAGLNVQSLADLLSWSEAEFLQRTEGSAIRRIGHVRWLRNVAVAAGNALRAGDACAPALRQALQAHLDHESEIVREHVQWALAQAPCKPSQVTYAP